MKSGNKATFLVEFKVEICRNGEWEHVIRSAHLPGSDYEGLCYFVHHKAVPSILTEVADVLGNGGSIY